MKKSVPKERRYRCQQVLVLSPRTQAAYQSGTKSKSKSIKELQHKLTWLSSRYSLLWELGLSLRRFQGLSLRQDWNLRLLSGTIPQCLRRSSHSNCEVHSWLVMCGGRERCNCPIPSLIPLPLLQGASHSGSSFYLTSLFGFQLPAPYRYCLPISGFMSHKKRDLLLSISNNYEIWPSNKLRVEESVRRRASALRWHFVNCQEPEKSFLSFKKSLPRLEGDNLEYFRALPSP